MKRLKLPAGRQIYRLLTLSLLLVFAIGLENAFIASAQENGEFDTHGIGTVRIESEVKLKLPIEQRDTVWDWLQNRYSDPDWLNRDGYVFNTTFGDEDFTD